MSLMFAGQSDAKIDSKSILGIWLFDKGADKIAKDFSKNGNDGEIFGDLKWVKVEATGNYQAVLIKTADGLLENYSGYIYAGRKVFWTRFTSGGPHIEKTDVIHDALCGGCHCRR